MDWGQRPDFQHGPRLSTNASYVGTSPATRDERRWTAPGRFDVLPPSSREPLAFGLGDYRYAGDNPARAELRALLAALAKRVRRFELHEASWRVVGILRGLGKCRVTLH